MKFKKNKVIIAIPPGETITELFNETAMNTHIFAERMNMTVDDATALIKGELPLSADVATRLEAVFGLSAQFWLNLEGIYREKQAKIRALKYHDSCAGNGGIGVFSSVITSFGLKNRENVPFSIDKTPERNRLDKTE